MSEKITLTDSVLNRQADYLAESAQAESLGHHAVRGGLATLSSQFAKFLVQTGATIILARLLTPKDFGILAMILAVTAFLGPFRDVGLSTATIQRAEIMQDQVSNLFWINTGVGAVLSIFLAVAAPLIAFFYGQPTLTLIIIIFSVKFLMEGLAIQHLALIQRRMRFGSLALLEVSALVAASAAAIGAAWTGWGYWALIIQQLTFPLVVAMGVWLICPWRPGLPSRKSGVRSLVTFGGQLTGSNIMFAFMRNFDNVLIGWRWGAEALGLYTKAYTLLLLPLNQISFPLHSVALTSLSKLQNDPDRYRRFYCQLIALLALLTTPILVVLGVLSHDIIYILLGEQWVGASTIFTVLAIAALGQPMGGTIGLVNVSLGQTDRLLRWSLITTPIFMISFLIGLPWGPLGVATAYAFAVHLIRFPTLWYAFRYSPVKIKDFLNAIWRPIAVSGMMFLFMAGTKFYLSGQTPIGRLVLCCLVGGVSLGGGILLWPETRRQTTRMIQQMIELWRQKRETPPSTPKVGL